MNMRQTYAHTNANISTWISEKYEENEGKASERTW